MERNTKESPYNLEETQHPSNLKPESLAQALKKGVVNFVKDSFGWIKKEIPITLKVLSASILAGTTVFTGMRVFGQSETAALAIDTITTLSIMFGLDHYLRRQSSNRHNKQ